jgi:hypothetical protein
MTWTSAESEYGLNYKLYLKVRNTANQYARSDMQDFWYENFYVNIMMPPI